jgi:hypothetical protein
LSQRREGDVVERGTLPDGQEYRVWRCRRTSKHLVYVGSGKGGSGKRRSLRWLRSTQQEEARKRLLTPLSDEEFAAAVASPIPVEEWRSLLREAELRDLGRHHYARALPQGRYR